MFTHESTLNMIFRYVDPDGVRREFEYVSGNPCDPNAPEEPEEQQSSEEDFDAQFKLRPANQARQRPVNNNLQGLEQAVEERAPVQPRFR